MYLNACTYVSAAVCAGFKAAIQGSFARRFGVFSSSSLCLVVVVFSVDLLARFFFLRAPFSST